MSADPEDVAQVRLGLQNLARSLRESAGRAATVDSEDTRNREAAQVRFVGELVRTNPDQYLAMGECWFIAGRKMLRRHNLEDRTA